MNHECVTRGGLGWPRPADLALADPGGRGDYGEEVRVLIIAGLDVLREKLGAEGARALAEALNQLGGEVRDAANTVAEERFESRLLGWAFAFWLGQFAVLIGILFAFFRN
jgi:hypothetical protein